MEMSSLTRDGTTVEPVLRDQILMREPCSADHEQDWHLYTIDPYSCYVWSHI